MSSPTRYRNSSPVRNLEERFYSKPLDVILEQNNAHRTSNSLIYQKEVLEQENQFLVHAVARSKDGETSQFAENIRLKREKEQLQDSFRHFETASLAQNQAQQQQLEGQERDIRLLRQEYSRQNENLRDQLNSQSNKITLIESSKRQEFDILKQKCINVTAKETEFVRKNLTDELRNVAGELEATKHLLDEKELENQHLAIIGQQRSTEYTMNLESMISEGNVLRHQLTGLEIEKNREIHQAENKKELEKSRTIGILSYCKENSHFLEKEVSSLAEQLLEKNISIESFTKELLKLRRNAEFSERKYEELIAKMKLDYEDQLREKDREFGKLESYHKEDIMLLKQTQAELEQKLSSSLNDLDNSQRELAHVKEQSKLKDKQIQELKENINRLHEDHSKELSKVMIDSRVKRRSGMNISSYSSSSLKDIEDAQGSSIIRVTSMERKNSNQMVGPGGLPVVKEELAVSHGHLDEDEEDIEIKELILHYESMIEELKKNKSNELSLASQKIETLKFHLDQKQRELIETLSRFEPLLELQTNRSSIEEDRRIKIEQSQRGDISILGVLLEKYSIVSLKPRNR